MENIFKKAFLVAIMTFILDFLFHYFLTRPMETLTYFFIKFLLSFFVAVALFSFNKLKNNKIAIVLSGFIFSILMSIYYRFWEFGEAHVPFGSRAPDIIGVARDNLFLFSGAWWIGHALFFIAGVLVSNKLIKK